MKKVPIEIITQCADKEQLNDIFGDGAYMFLHIGAEKQLYNRTLVVASCINNSGEKTFEAYRCSEEYIFHNFAYDYFDNCYFYDRYHAVLNTKEDGFVVRNKNSNNTIYNFRFRYHELPIIYQLTDNEFETFKKIFDRKKKQ